MSAAAAPDDRARLGTIMCRAGLLSESQLAQALAVQRETGRPLGEVIVSLGFASRGAVANALAEQFGGTLKTEYGISTGLGRLRPPEEHGLAVGGTLVQRAGPCPEEGTIVEDAHGRRFKVVRVVRCAYLEPVP